MENELLVEFNAKEEALKLRERFMPYVNDEQDRICDLMEIDTKEVNAKMCALITLAKMMETAIKYKKGLGLRDD